MMQFRKFFVWSPLLVAAGSLSLSFGDPTGPSGEFVWPGYKPTVAYDYQEEYGLSEPPTRVLEDGTGVAGTYAQGWWCFRWGADKSAAATEADWVPMLERLNQDFTYITDVMRWPRGERT